MEDAKRRRLWNPALEDGIAEESTMEQEGIPQFNPRATAFALAAFAQQQLLQQQMQQAQQPPSNPFLFQPYLSLALPLLTAHQNLQQAPPQAQKRKEPVRIKSASPPSSVPSSSPPSSTPSSSSSLTPSFNPIVKSALGIHVPNENCCAVCGAGFRLTTDLVTHMRNNHRRTKPRRKNDE